MRILIPFILAAIYLLSGCGTADKISDNHSLNLDHNGSNLMTRDVKPENTGDVVDQQTQNPNINIANSPLTIREAKEQIVRTLETEKGLELDSFWTNGDDAWAVIYTSQKLTEQQRENRQKELYDKLQRALPRYNLHVQLINKK
ncbi:hypothetical protein [Aeribacillus sp. FSL k6-2211]|uniref:hypothetical protein n=1 Tax=unclassified Aeribacillus TaxID=2640495 RepID=UPI0030D3AFF4